MMRRSQYLCAFLAQPTPLSTSTSGFIVSQHYLLQWAPDKQWGNSWENLSPWLGWNPILHLAHSQEDPINLSCKFYYNPVTVTLTLSSSSVPNFPLPRSVRTSDVNAPYLLCLKSFLFDPCVCFLLCTIELDRQVTSVHIGNDDHCERSATAPLSFASAGWAASIYIWNGCGALRLEFLLTV